MAVLDHMPRMPAALQVVFGDGQDAPLPKRVRESLAEEQDRAERLIGLVQLAVVAMFAALYFLSPTTYPPDVRFVPVPWALTAYFCFTLMRVWLSFRVRLPDWYLMLSILVDIGLLMTLIWSFHVQYEQPPSFYLKIPTLLYVFMFIALRTLRFEPRFVVAAGLTAATGWVVLVAYAALFSDSGTEVTHSFVEYMTMNAILIGAEFDKIISILVVTAILVVAQTQARRLLVRSVAEGQAAADLARFFDSGVAAQIRASESRIVAGEGQARDGAILFVDIRGFSKLSDETDPSALIRLLAEYQSLVVPAIQSNGGIVDKFLGDGVMATFGVASDRPNYAADALRALEAALGSIDNWNADRARQGLRSLDVSASAATGRVVFGAVGDDSRLEYTVIGDAVNQAAKLEKHTKREQVRAVVTADAYTIACRQGYRPAAPVEIRRQRRVEGISDPVDLMVLRK